MFGFKRNSTKDASKSSTTSTTSTRSMTDDSKSSSITDEPKRSSTSPRESRTRKSSAEKAMIAGIAMKEMDPADIIAILEMHAAAGNQEHAISCFESLKHTKRTRATSAA